MEGGRVALQQTSALPVAALRVLHLVSHPAQYYAPLYRSLAGRRDLALTVCFYAAADRVGFVGEDFNVDAYWDVPLTAGYNYRFLRGDQASPARRSGIPPAVVAFMMRENFDVLWVAGYSTPTAAMALLLGRLMRGRVLLMDDQTLLRDRPKTTRMAKAVILRLLFRKVFALYSGTNNRRFFRHYGIPEDRLFFAPHSVDNAFFQKQAASLAGNKGDLRLRFGLSPDAPVVLFCGKLVPCKDLPTLIQAFGRVRRNYRCSLNIVGDGPMRRQLEEMVGDQRIPDVRFSGFVNQTEIGLAYAAADLLVLPSQQETWGLVVNEGMNFSLPMIASDRVGCSGDLVIHNENGYIFPAGRVECLAERIDQLVRDERRRARFGSRSLQIIQDWDIGITAASIANACHSIAGR